MNGTKFNILTLTVPTLQLIYNLIMLRINISAGVNTIIKDN